MGGRFLNKLPAAEFVHIFRTGNSLPNYPARYNIALRESTARGTSDHLSIVYLVGDKVNLESIHERQSG